MDPKEIDFDSLCRFLDMRYVLQTNCADRHKNLEEEFTEVKLQNADNTTKLNLIIKIGSTAALAAVAAFATALCSLILK